MNPLSQMLAGLVDYRLEGAACTGHAPLFDPRGEREPDTEHTERVKLARAICATCPIINACHEVASNMRPRDRAGIWAGIAYDKHGRLTTIERGA